MEEVVLVRTYSGHKADERPISFIFKGKVYGVNSIVREWMLKREERCSPVFHCFLVAVEGSMRFELRHDLQRDLWTCIPRDVPIAWILKLRDKDR